MTGAVIQCITRPPRAALLCYGMLGLPLAMVALPIYVQAPTYYSEQLGAPLALIGAVLFAARLVDTVQDPFIGQWLDRLAQRQQLPWALWLAAVVLALAFAGIWLPPADLGAWGLSAWLGAMLMLAYSAHSVLQIAYLAWGARLAGLALQQRAAAWREALGLAGVVLASTAGVVLLQADATALQGMASNRLYVLLFAALLVVGLVALLRGAPVWQGQSADRGGDWLGAWHTPAFRRALVPFFLNALAMALPATLVMFFIADRLAAQVWTAAFLASYFVAAALSLPSWNVLAGKLGMVRAWRLSMLLAVAGFAITPWLGPESAWVFGAVCLVTGWALGADLVIVPVWLGSHIPAHAQAAGYYGLSSLLGKLALASSALALPLLAVVGYEPGLGGAHALWLGCLYAGFPCVFKLLAWHQLRHSPSAKESV
ncbi:sodium:galactoside symporter [Lampropedia aestuarii]|uniref:Sodium:galactoside symporter n=1 Tax=Lampropedia aestuarii TaxID=2562762 RepID=A0A4S5BJ35_9BURK|nr:MFS transporter [Lampropedia aestuarii]THJ32169.1 sodium:galactoside symporter [Lampropedia aestuarii]